MQQLPDTEKADPKKKFFDYIGHFMIVGGKVILISRQKQTK